MRIDLMSSTVSLFPFKAIILQMDADFFTWGSGESRAWMAALRFRLVLYRVGLGHIGGGLGFHGCFQMGQQEILVLEGTWMVPGSNLVSWRGEGCVLKGCFEEEVGYGG